MLWLLVRKATSEGYQVAFAPRALLEDGMRPFWVHLFILTLTVGLGSPALAHPPAQKSRHHDAGVVIYFGSGGGHIVNERHGHSDRHSYRQGYRDGYREGRDARHSYRHDRYDPYRYKHGFAKPPRDYYRPPRPRPSARHGLTAGDR